MSVILDFRLMHNQMISIPHHLNVQVFLARKSGSEVLTSFDAMGGASSGVRLSMQDYRNFNVGNNWREDEASTATAKLLHAELKSPTTALSRPKTYVQGPFETTWLFTSAK